MNARVFLLVLMTGLFMALWNGDQAAIEAALARRAQAQALQLAAANASGSSAPAAAAQTSESTAPVTAQSASRGGTAATVPLPAGMPAGEYQAVSQTGQTIRVSVERSATHSGEASVRRDLYISDAPDGTRWYLVRIQSATAL